MVTVGEPISTDGIDSEQLDELKTTARERIVALREKIRAQLENKS